MLWSIILNSVWREDSALSANLKWGITRLEICHLAHWRTKAFWSSSSRYHNKNYHIHNEHFSARVEIENLLSLKMDELLKLQFPTRRQLYRALRERTLSDGFDISIKRFGLGYCYLACIHGGKHSSHRDKKQSDEVERRRKRKESKIWRRKEWLLYTCVNGVKMKKPKRCTKKSGCE